MKTASDLTSFAKTSSIPAQVTSHLLARSGSECQKNTILFSYFVVAG